jgi:hypothetical protein
MTHKCTANDHAAVAQRLIMAELTDEGNDVDFTIATDRDIIWAEVGDCADCCRAIATHAVFYAATYMRIYQTDTQRTLAAPSTPTGQHQTNSKASRS